MTKRFSTETGKLRGRAPWNSDAVVVPRSTSWRRSGAGLPLALALLIGLSIAAQADVLRVGTSGDYAPFSVVGPEPGSPPNGFGPDVVRAFAADRGLEVEFVRFVWPELLDDLGAARFDVAVGGITVRPERSLAGVFSVPVATGGAVALVADGSEIRDAAQLDRPGVSVAVNAGGHLERVVRAHFPNARVLAIPDNARVLSALIERRADAAVTDTFEAPHWLARATGLRAVGPFTRDRKALLVRTDRTDLAVDLDTWLLAAEADGRLDDLRARSFGAHPAAERTATALAALLAGIDERLALMPDVAEAKRASGSAVEVPEREAKVVEAAVEEVRRSLAQMTGQTGVELDSAREAAVRGLFRAQIEAAKQIQLATLAKPPAPRAAPLPDLDEDLRPALNRIGNRIARLVVALPAGLDSEEILNATRRELAARDLPDARLAAIAEAIVATSRSAPRAEVARPFSNRASGSGGAAPP